jgi:cysteine desulfurase
MPSNIQKKEAMIYLDHAASTPDLSCTVGQNTEHWNANSHSLHSAGIHAHKIVEDAEKVVLDFINGHNGKIIWTGSGSQANMLAVNTLCSDSNSTLITSAVEHKSLLQMIQNYVIRVDSHGLIDPTMWTAVKCTTDLVSLQMVNNETGVMQPIKTARSSVPNNYFHTDAVQAFGKIPIDVEDLGVDALSFSSHKANGPKGLGGLWVHNRIANLFPYTGTVPVELICRLASVLKQKDQTDSLILKSQWINELERLFFRELRKTDVGPHGLNAITNRTPGILSIHFPGVNGDDLMFSLSEQGVYVSTGSACNSGEIKPSHVLTAMGITEEVAYSTIRISIGVTNTLDEMIKVAQIIGNTTKELKNGS